MLTFQPDNWPGVIDAIATNDWDRFDLIADAHEIGVPLRLDSIGISLASQNRPVPVENIALNW